jgi:tol-pal system protein YbgF
MCSLGVGAQAAIFGDDEARRAILDLRQRLEALGQRQSAEQQRQSAEQQRQSAEQQRQSAEQQRQSAELQRLIDEAKKTSQALARAAEENAQLRRSLLDLSNEIEQVRTDLARLRGQDEQLAREVSEVQRRLKDVSNDVEDRFRSMEPVKVSVDGRDFLATPAEIRDFDAALVFMRKGEFAQAQSAFTSFMQRHPGSGYQASALFWLGNAQYAMRNYKESLASLRAMLSESPEHVRASEAMLAVANALTELKEPRPVLRSSLEDLVKAHPLSEAANVARDRLAKLRSMEPVTVSVDGRDFLATPAEIRDFDAALAFMRKGEFAQAQSAFASFVQRHPGSGYQASALFWLGNAQYATRNYKESLVSLRAMLSESPEHVRAPEAMLAVANALTELKEPRPVLRRSLEDLVKAHPLSEAANVARDRLAKRK